MVSEHKLEDIDWKPQMAKLSLNRVQGMQSNQDIKMEDFDKFYN